MKRSEKYYLNRVSRCVEKIRRGESVIISSIPEDTLCGMKDVFELYLEHLWMRVGDTAFNRMNYRSATDYLFEQLDLNT